MHAAIAPKMEDGGGGRKGRERRKEGIGKEGKAGRCEGGGSEEEEENSHLLPHPDTSFSFF